MWQARTVTEAFTSALIAELGKKTGVCWLRRADQHAPSAADASRPRAAWHIWHDDALHLIAGGTEQPLEDLAEAEVVEVTMRSKENGGRLVTWIGDVRVVPVGSDGWDEAVTALAADRLNLPDLSRVRDDWAANSVVIRIDPTGELVEAPGALSDAPHAAPPPSTPATTRGVLPRVLHRRQKKRPPLS